MYIHCMYDVQCIVSISCMFRVMFICPRDLREIPERIKHQTLAVSAETTPGAYIPEESVQSKTRELHHYAYIAMYLYSLLVHTHIMC